MHVDGFGYCFFNCAVGESFSGGDVDADWSWWLRVPELCEGIAYWNGLLTIMEGGAYFSFSGRRHHVLENLGEDVDRAVERGVGDRWIDRVGGLVAKEVVATYAAASAGFGKVGVVTVDVQDHVTGTVLDGGFGVGCSLIYEPNGGVTDFLHCFRLLGSNDDDGNEHGRVDDNMVVE